jgi:hypothetical protein
MSRSMRDVLVAFGRASEQVAPAGTSPVLAAAGLGALMGTCTGLIHALARPLAGEGHATGREVVVHGLIGATMGSIIGGISGKAASSIKA